MMNINTAISPPPSFQGVLLRTMERLRVYLAAALENFSKSSERELEQRFAEIIQDYGSVISGICFSYASGPDDIKDLRQDILINIWKGLRKFRGESSLSTWIYRVALNTCVSTVRKRAKRVSTVSLTPDQEIPDMSGKDTESIEWLHSQIERLSPIDKAIITMWLDERKYEEIAEVTGLSRNNVAVRINRIKEKLSNK